jgi:hypothetical protein
VNKMQLCSRISCRMCAHPAILSRRRFPSPHKTIRTCWAGIPSCVLGLGCKAARGPHRQAVTIPALDRSCCCHIWSRFRCTTQHKPVPLLASTPARVLECACEPWGRSAFRRMCCTWDREAPALVNRRPFSGSSNFRPIPCHGSQRRRSSPSRRLPSSYSRLFPRLRYGQIRPCRRHPAE